MTVQLAYFAIVTGALDDDKARALRMELEQHIPAGWVDPVVSGVMTRLWSLAARRGEDDGDLGDRSAKQLARALGWPASPEVLIDALLDAGLLETNDEGRFRPHDWADHQPGIQDRIRQRERREAQAKKKAAPETASSSGERDAPGQSRSDLDASSCDQDAPVRDQVTTGKGRKEGRKAGRQEGRDPDLFSKGRATESREPPPTEPPPLLTLPTRGGADWPLTRAIADALADAYPGVDVLAEARKAREWLNANPTKRKTPRGCREFVRRWIERAVNTGRFASARAPPSAQHGAMSAEAVSRFFGDDDERTPRVVSVEEA